MIHGWRALLLMLMVVGVPTRGCCLLVVVGKGPALVGHHKRDLLVLGRELDLRLKGLLVDKVLQGGIRAVQDIGVGTFLREPEGVASGVEPASALWLMLLLLLFGLAAA